LNKMQVVKFFSFILLLLFAACSNKQNKPAILINKDTMVNIITDMHLGDAILISPSVQQKPYKINSEKFYNQIISKHNITKKIFEENINYYSKDTAQFKKIYEDVIQRLSLLEGNAMNSDTNKSRKNK